MNLIKTINLHGTPISLEDTVRKISLDCKYPVGSSYIQYPMSKSPRELWGDFSTWENVYFGGSFLRTEGVFNEGTTDELKLEFMNGFRVESYNNENNRLTVTLDSSNPDLDKIKIGMRVFDKYRYADWSTVTNIENNVISCNSSITLSGDHPTLYFGISWATQSHEHGGNCVYKKNGWYEGNDVQGLNGAGKLKKSTSTSTTCTTSDYNLNNNTNTLVRSHFVTFDDNGETRAKNITISIWRRTA